MKKVKILLSVTMLLSGYAMAGEGVNPDQAQEQLLAGAAQEAAATVDGHAVDITLQRQQELQRGGVKNVAAALSRPLGEYTTEGLVPAVLRATRRVQAEQNDLGVAPTVPSLTEEQKEEAWSNAAGRERRYAQEAQQLRDAQRQARGVDMRTSYLALGGASTYRTGALPRK